MAKKIEINLDLKTNGSGQIKALTLDLEDFERAVSSAARVSHKAVKEMDSHWYDSITRVSATCATLGTSLQHLQGALKSISGDYQDFSKAMRLANSMAGKDEAGFEQLTDQVARLAKSVPMARDALAQGLYQVISNGVPEGNWIDYLEKSARAAVGGAADLGQVVGVTSTIIKNYGLAWDDAGSIQDKIQLTARNGVTSFEQLAAALPRVTGNAATLGVSVDELLAAFATLTGVSGNTAEVSTQLAAIFTALVKPSSEAGKMAEAMGIQFNAAAVKAAGGMQNFLKHLDSSVKSYAASAGVLEQEVYARLFGSAESLRALIPLQGELASKFQENASQMSDSAGTIDFAFKQNAATAESSSQLLQNQWAVLTDYAGRFASKAQPTIQFIAITGQATTGLISMGNALRVIGIRGAVLRVLRNNMVAYAMSCEVGARSTFLLKVGIKGLLISSGVGIAVLALTEAIGYFVRKSDEAKEKAEALRREEEAMRRTDENAAEARRRNAVAMEEARVKLDAYMAKIHEFNGSKTEEQKLINELNATYGASMGHFDTLAKWYEALTKNSKAYCQQLANEAEMQLLAQQIAEKRRQAHDIAYNPDGTARKYSTKRLQARKIEKLKREGISYSQVADTEIGVFSELDESNAKLKKLNTEVAVLSKQMEKLASQRIQMPVMGEEGFGVEGFGVEGEEEGKGKGKEYIAAAGSLDDYRKKLTDVKAALSALSPAKARERAELIALSEEYQRQIDLLEEWLGLKSPADGVRGTFGAIKPPADAPAASVAAALPQTAPADLAPTAGVMEMAAESFDKYTDSVERNSRALERNREQNQLVGDAVANIGATFGSLSKVVDDAAGEWLNYAANALQAIAQVLPQILALTDAQAGQAIAGATASGAQLPFPYNIISIGAGVAAVIAALASVPKFADGGIAYGPTLGLFGEYAGASHNPEVVAPLDRLRALLAPAPGVINARVIFRAHGRELVGVMDTRNNYSSRTK